MSPLVPIEPLSLFGILSAWGPFGLVAIMWYTDSRRYAKLLSTYKQDLAEVRQMYEANVGLVKEYEKLATDLREVVIMNTQAMTVIAGEVRQNQYCPMLRVKKEKQIREVGR